MSESWQQKNIGDGVNTELLILRSIGGSYFRLYLDQVRNLISPHVSANLDGITNQAIREILKDDWKFNLKLVDYNEGFNVTFIDPSYEPSSQLTSTIYIYIDFADSVLPDHLFGAEKTYNVETIYLKVRKPTVQDRNETTNQNETKTFTLSYTPAAGESSPEPEP